MNIRRIFVIGLSALLFACTSTADNQAAGTPDAAASRSKAQQVSRALGRGNNLMAAKTMNRTAAREDFVLLKNSGFEHVRLGYKLDEVLGPEYTVPSEHIQYLRQLVDWALEQDLLVVLDPIHNWANGPHTFQPQQDFVKFQKIWQQVALAFADYDTDQLVFEILNEPHDKKTKQAIAAQVIRLGLEAIRMVAGNRERMVIVAGDGFSTRQALIDAFEQDEIPADDPYLIATFHYYDPRPFTKQGAKNLLQPASWGSAEEIAELTAKFDAIRSANQNWAERHDTQPLPVYLGEFGVNNQADEDSRSHWLRAVRDAAEQRGYSWAHWNMYNNSPTAKGMGPWTETQQQDPTLRRFDPAPLEALVGN